jgi:hypothetical protein
MIYKMDINREQLLYTIFNPSLRDLRYVTTVNRDQVLQTLDAMKILDKSHNRF